MKTIIRYACETCGEIYYFQSEIRKCAICGNDICKECEFDIDGKRVCEECMKKTLL